MSAVAPIEIENPEVWQRLESSPAWLALTNAQKVFVTEFLASGSALLATKIGYRAKNDSNARVLSYELEKNPRITAALAVAAGRAPKVVTVDTERARLIREVRKQLRAAEAGSVAAQRLTYQLERLTLGQRVVNEDDQPEVTAEESAQVFPIGAILRQDGKSYRVVAEEIA